MWNPQKNLSGLAGGGKKDGVKDSGSINQQDIDNLRRVADALPSLLAGLILGNGFLAAAHLVEDDVGGGFPDEGLRFIVPVRQPLINRSLQFAHTKESAAADHSVGDESEKAFHLIEPGTTGRCEVKVEAPPLFRLEPSLNDLTFMGGIVVHDQMHLLVRWHLFLQLVEKFDKLLGAMARLATANHPPVQDVEGRE